MGEHVHCAEESGFTGVLTPSPQASDSEERSHHQAVVEAMQVIGFSAEEVGSVHRILAAILHLVSLARGLAYRPHAVAQPPL